MYLTDREVLRVMALLRKIQAADRGKEHYRRYRFYNYACKISSIFRAAEARDNQPNLFNQKT